MLTLTENARHAVEDIAERAGLPEAGGLRIAEADTPGKLRASPSSRSRPTGTT